MKFIFILFLSITLISCQESLKSNALSQDQLSVWICQCAAPIVEYNNELKTLAAADNIGQLTEKMTNGDQIMKAAELCITDKLNSSIKHLLDANLNQKISLQCQLEQRMMDDLISKVGAFDERTFK